MVRGQGSCALGPLMVTQSCQRWLWGWNTAASFTVWDCENLLDGHELACVRSWGGKETQTTAAGQQAIQDSLHFLVCIYARFLSERDIMQLIMTRKIIAAQMMKTLDLRPQGDTSPTSVVRGENLLPNQRFPVLLCGLRKRERRMISAALIQDEREELWSQLNLSHMGKIWSLRDE